MALASGKFRSRIKIQKATETADSFGQIGRSWSEEVSQPAHVIPIIDKERLLADKVDSRLRYKIRLRFNPEIILTTRDRILLNGKILNIISVVDENNRHREWIVHAIENS